MEILYIFWCECVKLAYLFVKWKKKWCGRRRHEKIIEIKWGANEIVKAISFAALNIMYFIMKLFLVRIFEKT